MSKRCRIRMTVGMMLIAMALSACGKKEEAGAEPLVVELPINEEVNSVLTDVKPEEVADEVFTDAQEEKTPATKSSQADSSTQQKKQSVTTRSTKAHPHQYEADVDGHWFVCGCDMTKAAHESDELGVCTICGVDVKAMVAQRDALLAQSMSNNVTTRNASDDTKTDSGNDSNNKTESGSTSNPTNNPKAEYPLVDADPLTKNIEVLNSALWRERLNGNQKFFLPVKDFYFASKDVTPAQMKQEIDSLVGHVDCVTNISYVTTLKNGIDLDSYVTIYVEDGSLFGSRQAFDAAYEKAKSERVPLKSEGSEDGTEEGEQPEVAVSEIELLNMSKAVLTAIDSMSYEEYQKFRLSLYEFLLSCALRCNTAPTSDSVITDSNGILHIKDTYEVSFDDFIQAFFECEDIYYCLVKYDSLTKESDKEYFAKKVNSAIFQHATANCFWFESVSMKDYATLQLQFSMFPVYETVEAQDGSVTTDKSRYKSIATMAKEVDDKLNRVIDTVIDPNMSIFAKEYALFHYCDSYFNYDTGTDGGLGGSYAIYDKPYTIAAPVNPDTGKKDADLASYSTQHKTGIYTTAMTGWGICVGHADFFQALCTKAEIQCEIEDGSSMGVNHTWNIVTINENSYLVDAGKRAPYPHFNITGNWKDTYAVIDNEMYGCLKDKSWYKNSVYPTYIYQAGYVSTTTQQDGEWIYYINFDDNGSLYKVNVDGTGNQKIMDSGTTIEEGYNSLAERGLYNEYWPDQWAVAEYGSQYNGAGYQNTGALDYRWALGMNFYLKKENGAIVYKVDNINKTEIIPISQEQESVIDIKCNMNDDYFNLGVISGYATVDANKSPGDFLVKCSAVVDGIEYPMTEAIESEGGTRVDFSFRLPTDTGMGHYDFEVLIVTANGNIRRESVTTQTQHPYGVKEIYLWNGKYYTIEGMTAREGKLFMYFDRYTADGRLEQSSQLIFDGYSGKDNMDVSFKIVEEMPGIFSIFTESGNRYAIQLSEDENLVIKLKDINHIYIRSAEEFIRLAEAIKSRKFLTATVEVCEDLDFSNLPEGVNYTSIGAGIQFKGKWHGNNYKMSGWTSDKPIFGELSHATIQDVCISDCNFLGADYLGVIYRASESDIHNIWVENVDIQGSNMVGVISYAVNADIHDIYLSDVKVSGEEHVAGLCAYAMNTKIDKVQLRGTQEISGMSYVGGIVGLCTGSDTEIKNCLSEAKILSTQMYAGGVAGYAKHAGDISHSINYGDVVSEGQKIGGIVGGISDNSVGINHVENHGAVQGEGFVGGIVGDFQGGEKLTNAVNSGTVTGKNYVGGISGGFDLVSNPRFSHCMNKGQVSGESCGGSISGQYMGSNQIFHTLCTPWENALTDENLDSFIGEYSDTLEIITDTEIMPADAGRQAYWK